MKSNKVRRLVFENWGEGDVSLQGRSRKE